MATTQSFNYSMGIQSSNIVATGIAIYLMGRLGRRTFMMSGLTAIATCMLIIGILGVVGISAAARGAGVGAMMVLINLSFKLSLGPAVYTIIGETPNSRVRAQSIVLARTSYILGNLVNGQIIPRQLGVKAWNWGAKCGFYWLGLCLIGITYIYFRLPEMKGRSFLELDHLFAERVPARKFKGYHLDLDEIRKSDKDNAFERVAAEDAPTLPSTTLPSTTRA
jgi:SP family general alpha glucoside:H+ symporter-like MFS transporter